MLMKAGGVLWKQVAYARSVMTTEPRFPKCREGFLLKIEFSAADS